MKALIRRGAVRAGLGFAALVLLLPAGTISGSEERASAGDALGRWRLAGVLTLQEVTQVSLLDPSGRCYWIKVGDRIGDVSVAELLRDPLSVRLTSPRGERVVELKQARIKALDFEPRQPARNASADIAFDAGQIILFERLQELGSRERRR